MSETRSCRYCLSPLAHAHFNRRFCDADCKRSWIRLRYRTDEDYRKHFRIRSNAYARTPAGRSRRRLAMRRLRSAKAFWYLAPIASLPDELVLLLRTHDRFRKRAVRRDVTSRERVVAGRVDDVMRAYRALKREDWNPEILGKVRADLRVALTWPERVE